MIKINVFVIVGIVLPIMLIPGVLYGHRNLRYFFMLLAICALLFLAYYDWTGVKLGEINLGEVILAPVSFSEHAYSRIVVFGFTLVGSMGLLYGLQLSEPREQVLALTALASAIGIVFADNFIILFIFWEMLTLSTAGLILLGRTPRAIIAGLYFLFFHLAGGLIVLFGILQHHVATGSFILTEPQAGLTLFIIGFGFKAAFLPLHLWLVRGYPSANFPSSVLLAGLTTKVGVYAIARILPPHEVIMLMGASMAVFGVVCALLQQNMRRLLSYHIISQVGYMVAGVGLATNYAVDGALLHVVNHMLYKALLFMSAGAVLYATRIENLHDLIHKDSGEDEKLKQNIWKAMPLITIGAIVGALAISGFPFFNGYVSKYLLKKAMYDMGPAEIMLMIASIGTAASFCKLIVFGYIQGRAKIINKVPVSSQLAIGGAAFFCILLGVYPQLISSLLPYGSVVDYVYTAESIWGSIRLVTAGALLYMILAATLKRGLHLSPAFSLEHLVLSFFFREVKVNDMTTDQLYEHFDSDIPRSSYYLVDLDQEPDESFDEIGQSAFYKSAKGQELDRQYKEQIRNVVWWNQQQWSIKNLNFDNLLLAVALGAILFIIFFYGA